MILGQKAGERVISCESRSAHDPVKVMKSCIEMRKKTNEQPQGCPWCPFVPDVAMKLFLLMLIEWLGKSIVNEAVIKALKHLYQESKEIIQNDIIR